jgi:integrase
VADTYDMSKRSYGTGALFVRTDCGGREMWYGQWRTRGRLVKRKLGLKREPGTRNGLTHAQAERELRRRIESEVPHLPSDRRLTLEEAGSRFIQHLEAVGRKPSTLVAYRSALRVHLVPYFGDGPFDAVSPEDVEGFMSAMRRQGLSSKSIRNYVGILGTLYAHWERRALIERNPVRHVDLPAREHSADVRWLDQSELHALIAATGGTHPELYRALFLTAAMTGLRQGELLALRWRDVDWAASRARVRQNYVRGRFGAPKSKRSTRSVPLADRVAGELERVHQGSQWQHEEDLVFAHPYTGRPLERAQVLRVFKNALKAAALDQRHVFHDLRHTFGTRMAAAGVPLRTLQEWMGHRDYKTTAIYADYAPSAHERELVERAFEIATTPRGEPPRTLAEQG